jgi:DNA-binding SARP family transcriptional activator
MVQVFVNFWRGWATLEAGDSAAARVMFERSWQLGKVSDHGTTLAHSTAMLGYASLADEQLDDATARFLDALGRHTALGDVWGISLDIEGIAAVAAARGEMIRTVSLLSGADALRDRMGIALPAVGLDKRARRIDAMKAALGSDFDRLYADGFARPLNDLIRKAQGEDITATHAIPAPHMSAVQATNGAAPPLDEAATPRLAVDALGPLQVFVGGTAIDAGAWGSARSRELLLYLLTHPDGVTKEQVGLAFWPDASTPQLRNNFHVTLHRLRKTLGEPSWITLTHERYAVDAAILQRFDVAVFESEVKAARKLLKRQEEGAVAALERALTLYRGDFMDGEPAGDWHLDLREQLQRVYIEALMELGAAQTKEQRYAKAAEAYRRVLARDELHEEALRALMLSQARQGERTPALRLYQRFSERLRRELDASPDRATTSLFERLQAGETV